MSDVEMAETRPSSVADGTSADAAEKKKALLVYKSNQQSASDDDDDDDDGDDDDDDDEEEDADLDAAGGRDDDDIDDAVSVKSGADVDMAADAEEEDDDDEDLDVDDDDEDGGVRVEKDDDDSINAPSDDDLDSTATPLRATDTDEETSNKANKVATREHGGDSDSASAVSPIKTEDGGKTSGALKSGSDVTAIIAARRRTGARKECEVCQEPRNGRRAMLCTSCKCMYHSSCYRQRFNKLISASGKQWFCPDCETTVKAEAEAAAAAEREALTPRKKREDAGKARSMRGSKAAPVGKGNQATGGNGDATQVANTGATSASTTAVELELKRITDIALRGGKKINNMVLERTEEMLQVTQSLTTEIENVMGSAWRENENLQLQNGGSSSVFTIKDEERQPPPFTMPSSSTSLIQEALSPVSHSPTNDFKSHHGNSGTNTSDSTEKDVLLTRVRAGLASLKDLLQQLQVTGIQFEVDLTKEIKLPPPKEDSKFGTASASTAARKAPSSAAAAAARANAIIKGKNGASRLYSSKQIQKLEDWYQKSSRPESCEIQAMYRIINSPEYADKELQPEGISVKQIRIWFDNRRAKERLDYMRLKMKDISTTDMDVESVKRMKAAYIDEAKEVLEARVSRLRENGKGPGEIVDEAGELLLSGGDRSLPTTKGGKASPSSKLNGGPDTAVKLVLNPKKRIRIDHVASVRRAVKDARDSGKSEEEIKAVRAAAIERARERTHIPYKNARQGPTKPLGKDEVTHIKLKMLKQLEEDASAEELTDLIELLLSVIIPREILIESALHRQLNLVLKAHKDNKELVKQTNKLLDEYNMIVEKGDSIFAGIVATGEEAAKKKLKKKEPSLLLDVETESLPAGSPGASPDSPAASPDSRRPRVKFSLEQLVKLEKYFHKDDTPSKKKLDKLADKLNDIGARDPASDEAQKSIDYKQIRCWFYKRRSTNQRPQALTSLDIQEVGSSSGLSETESDSDDEGSVSSKSPATGGKSKSSGKRKASALVTGETKAPAVKRSKKDPATTNTTTASSSSGEAKAAARTSSSSTSGKREAKMKDASGKHPGRIFNVKQLATIIEEYEKNPRPSVSRLEELQNILNQDDHADDNFVNPTGVTKRQIKTWFSNRRAKERLDLIKMKVQDGSGHAEADTADSETEDDDRRVDTKKNKTTMMTTESGSEAVDGDAARKELFVGESAANKDDDMDSDDVNDDLSDADSEKSAPAATSVQSSGSSKMPSMRMLVDDDDDSDDDDDDDDDDLDSDDDA